MPVGSGTLDYMKLAIILNGVDGFSKVFSNARKAMRGIKDEAKATQVRNAKLMEGFANLSAHVSALASVALMQFIQKSVESADEFDKTTRIISVGLTGMNGDLKETQRLMMHLSEGGPFTPTQIADLTLFSMRLGLSKDEILTLTPAAEKFAYVGGVTLTEAMRTAATASSVFNIEMTEMEDVMSKFTRASMLGQANVQELNTSFQYLAPIWAQTGGTLEELLASLTQLSYVGLKGSKAGTGLRQALLKMLNPTAEGQYIMSKYNLELQVFSERAKKANAELVSQTGRMETLKTASKLLEMELTTLSLTMAGFGIKQSKIQLRMMKIRYRAARQNRSMSALEEEAMKRLSLKSDKYAIKLQEMSVRSSELSLSNRQASVEISALKDSTTELAEEVKYGITGLVSMDEVLRQLSASGIESGAIMKIFSMRGGAAMLGLLTAMHNASSGATLLKNLIKDLSKEEGKNTVMNKMYAKALDGIAGSYDRATAAAEKNAIKTGTELAPALLEIKRMIYDLYVVFTPLIYAVKVSLLPIKGFLWLLERFIGMKPALAYLTAVLWGLAGAKIALGIATQLAGANIPMAIAIGAAAGVILGTLAGVMASAQSDMTSYAKGRVVTSPEVALVGEHGPEAIVPLEDGAVPVRISGDAGGFTNYGTINVYANDPQEFMAKLREEFYGV